VIVHRIELQETERATLEAALAGRFVTNAATAAGSVFTGIGNLLAPFGGALTAIAALWIADKSIDEILDAAKTAGEKQKKKNESTYTDSGIKNLETFGAWLESSMSMGGWDRLCNGQIAAEWLASVSNPLDPINFLPSWFRDRCIQFLETVCNPNNVQARTSGLSIRELWAAFYPIEEYISNAYYHETNGTASGGVWKTVFG
jgi:hypothetical protein